MSGPEKRGPAGAIVSRFDQHRSRGVPRLPRASETVPARTDLAFPRGGKGANQAVAAAQAGAKVTCYGPSEATPGRI